MKHEHWVHSTWQWSVTGCRFRAETFTWIPCGCMGCDGDGWVDILEDSFEIARIRAKLAEQEAKA